MKNTIPRTFEEAKKYNYKFWSSQPIQDLNNNDFKESPISKLDNMNLIKLPYQFQFVTLDISEHCDKISEFLNKYYVEDTDSEFRLHFSSDFLRWHIKKPNYHPELCLGIEVKSNNQLVGFISGIPIKHQLNMNTLDTIEINFLCVHPKLRNKEMATVLISEIKRRSIDLGYQQAFYTTERYIPKPFFTAKYYHRAINIIKLIETKFIKINNKIKIDDLIKYFDIRDEPFNDNFVKMEEQHILSVYDKFNDYMERYNFYPIYSIDEFKHIFYNNKYVSSYVLLDDDDEVLDFISYYKLPTKILKFNQKHDFINIGYVYYYTSIEETPYRLIMDLIIVAKKEGIDVMNILDIMENESHLNSLKFELGTGRLNYNIFNYKVKSISGNGIGKMII
jgi:glycylpeptide N-tetradecanoyltransferase